MVRIIIGGDICPMRGIQDAFIKGDALEIFHDLTEEIASADLSIVNLECPLIMQDTRITKVGGVLGASSECINGFAGAGWKVINLANNHSYDHGASGLQETIRSIETAGMSVVGAGMNIKEAQTPQIKQINSERFVIYAMAEREFSIADLSTPGANPLDLIGFVDAVRQYKQQGIFIVLLHGGKEYYPYPSPEMVRRCRFMVDMGADAVICCHSHCPQPWEIYCGRPIIYGLGNLIFEATKEPEVWYEGYMARLSIEAGRVQFEPLPYVQSKERHGARKMNQTEQKKFIAEMKIKNERVKDEIFIKSHWKDFCRQQRNTYLASLFGYNRLMFKMRSVLLRTLISKAGVIHSLHLVQCETHKEILDTIFEEERRAQ